MQTRHFLSLLDLSSEELRGLIHHAIDVKQSLKAGISHTPLSGKVLAMVFEKSSTRTRVSFESGMSQECVDTAESALARFREDLSYIPEQR